jgi:phospholipid/cholesterol/gamma-HCH transport system substrate-binding protein
MRRAIREHLGDFAALLSLAVVSVAIGVYVYINQESRSKIPFFETPYVTLLAEFSDAQAVTPGQGQSVRVAGVKVGLIQKVGVQEGKAVVELAIDGEYAQLIHKDATALLRPRTGLNDMFIEIDPGTPQEPVYGEGGRIPVRNTAPPIDQDEFLAALDVDTRAYLQLLINGAGNGFKNRGDDFREILRRFEPLHRDLARIQQAVAERRTNLRSLVHNYQSLTNELGDKDRSLIRLVTSANQVFDAFANEDDNVSSTVVKLAPALRQTEETLGKVDRYSDVLGPTLQELRPAFRNLTDANEELIPFAKEATPIVRDQIRPFVRDARPFVRDLRPAARDLSNATPELTTSFKELNRFFNIAAYNPEGANPEGDRDNYLFWAAWVTHNSNSLFSTSDAEGPLRRLVTTVNCDTLRDTVRERSGFAQAFGFLDERGLSPIVNGSGLCPGPDGGDE